MIINIYVVIIRHSGVLQKCRYSLSGELKFSERDINFMFFQSNAVENRRNGYSIQNFAGFKTEKTDEILVFRRSKTFGWVTNRFLEIMIFKRSR